MNSEIWGILVEADFFHPEMVGRENELKQLTKYLDEVLEGKGNTVFVSGEAGIGKTRLVEELKKIAQAEGCLVMSGNSLVESLTPYLPFFDALRSGGLESLFAEETPRVEGIYLMTRSGLLVKEVLREQTKVDSDVFAAMLSIVTDFIKDSIKSIDHKPRMDSLRRIGYGDFSILIGTGESANLVVTMTGRDNEYLIDDMMEILRKVHRFYGNVLGSWDGDEDRVGGVDNLMHPLITSGKYDGIFYGKENPRAKRNLLFENVTMGLSRQAKEKSTLLCLEDLQWADPSTLAMMHYVTRNTKKSGLLIIGTYRPEDVSVDRRMGHPLNDTMQLMNREGLYDKIDLNRLTEKDTVTLVKSMLEETEFNTEFNTRIYEETEGNPLFVLELIESLLEDGTIRKDDGTWMLTRDLEDDAIPSRVHDVILRRLNRVNEREKKVLDYASVIGEVFSSITLETALQIGRLQLLETLRTLEQTHRLIHSHPGNYKFDHVKIKEVLYNEIPLELRMEYHSIVGESIERLNKDDIDRVIGDLAFHYYQCRKKEKAAQYLAKAAEKAKNDYSNKEAIEFYNKVLEFEEDTEKRIGIFDSLGDVHSLIGEVEKSTESFERELELTKDRRKIAGIMVKIGRNHLNIAEFDTALTVLNEAWDMVKNKMCEEEARALNTIGLVHGLRDESKKALEYYEECLEIYEKIGNQRGIAGTSNNMGIEYLRREEYGKAMRCFEKSHEVSEGIGDLEFVGIHLGNIGNVFHETERFDKAIEYFEKSLEVSEKIGQQRQTGGQLLNIGNVFQALGEYDKAEDYYKRSLEICIKIQDKRLQSSIISNQGLVSVSKGNYEVAIRLLQESIDMDETMGNFNNMCYSLTGLAEVHLHMGNLKEARDICNRVIELSKRLSLMRSISESLRVLAMIFREEKKWTESIENFERSIEIYQENNYMNGLSDAYYEFGLMWKAKGETEKAVQFLDKAFSILEERGIKKRTEKVKNALKAIKQTN